MNLFHLLAIAIGLSADSFAVATTEGLLVKSSRHIHTLRVALVLGACQSVMPIIGWLAGQIIQDIIAPYANGAAFLILAVIGIKMCMDSLKTADPRDERRHSVGFKLWMLGAIVSLDALGVGMSLAMMDISMWQPVLVIGLVTAIVSAIGVQTGDRLGRKIGKKAELAGGVILIAIAITFLL